ncbi:MAG TPA: molybdate ABC transporter substrate-binding protein [Polyangiaceae bacterium]|nr:molybdate ABC transporter substrate-binding protein [Polyangiaceae bacterium]
MMPRLVQLASLIAMLAFGCSRQPSAEKQKRAREPVRIAVASNFAGPAAQLARAFEKRHPGARVELSSGASGKLFAQIVNGAPFDIFLSADGERPRKLEAEGHAVAGSRVHYALGRLVLVGPGMKAATDGPSVLRKGEFEHLAIANPETAPYGLAAQQVLTKLGLWETLGPRLVRGENITQAYQFVTSGGAELGFVALALVLEHEGPRWDVPPGLHEPIRQDAVLLTRAKLPLANDFMAFLKSAAAKTMIRAAGYGTE